MMAPPVPELTMAERKALDNIGWPLVPSSKAKLLAEIALDPTVKVKDAADAAGVDRDLVRKWRSRDDAFALAERRARNGGDPREHVAVSEPDDDSPPDGIEPGTPAWYSWKTRRSAEIGWERQREEDRNPFVRFTDDRLREIAAREATALRDLATEMPPLRRDRRLDVVTSFNARRNEAVAINSELARRRLPTISLPEAFPVPRRTTFRPYPDTSGWRIDRPYMTRG